MESIRWFKVCLVFSLTVFEIQIAGGDIAAEWPSTIERRGRNDANPSLRRIDSSFAATDSCGQIFGEVETIIKSPGYPSHVPAHLRCDYTFRTPFVCENDYHIEYVDFYLNCAKNCSKSGLLVNGEEKLCGSIIGVKTYRTANGVLQLSLLTGEQLLKGGFRLVVTRLPCLRGVVKKRVRDLTEIGAHPSTTDTNVEILSATETPYYDDNGGVHEPGVTAGTPYQKDTLIPNVRVPFDPASVLLPPFEHGGGLPYLPPDRPPHFDSTGGRRPYFPINWPPRPSQCVPPSLSPVPLSPQANFDDPPSESGLPQSCCKLALNEQRFYIASPGFPTTILSPEECTLQIDRATSATCRLRIEFRFFAFGEQRTIDGACDRDFLEIDGQKLCGCLSGLTYLSQWNEPTKVIRYRTAGRLAMQVRGFLLDVIQEECPYRLSDSHSVAKRQTAGILNAPTHSSYEIVKLREPHTTTIQQTNASSLTTIYFFDSPHEGGYARPVAAHQRAVEPTDSPFFWPTYGARHPQRCIFSLAQWMQLIVDRFWLNRSPCFGGRSIY